MDIQIRPTTSVHPYPGNPRSIHDRAVQEVARSIESFGFRQPIVVDEEGVIIVGHTRHLAAQRLGLYEVPVVVADDLSEEQVRAYRLADNKTGEIASWDNDRLRHELAEIEAGTDRALEELLPGFSAKTLDRLLADLRTSDDGDESEDPPPREETWQLGPHRLVVVGGLDEELREMIAHWQELSDAAAVRKGDGLRFDDLEPSGA